MGFYLEPTRREPYSRILSCISPGNGRRGESALGRSQTRRIPACPIWEAIEAEDFAQLPAGIYALSYIRQYAGAIGFDETAVVARYRNLIEPEG
jgi:hypothetical protein